MDAAGWSPSPAMEDRQVASSVLTESCEARRQQTDGVSCGLTNLIDRSWFQTSYDFINTDRDQAEGFHCSWRLFVRIGYVSF
jgi:hypothetical protein